MICYKVKSRLQIKYDDRQFTAKETFILHHEEDLEEFLRNRYQYYDLIKFSYRIIKGVDCSEKFILSEAEKIKSWSR
jgi:hypothetical protein